MGRAKSRERLLSVTVILLVTAAACSRLQSPQVQAQKVVERIPDRELTLEQLALCDGAMGRPAYIAVNGLVYDVTSAKDWKEGVHRSWSKDRVAGRDLTSALGKAPPSHRLAELWAGVTVVGRLRDKKD